MLIQKNKHMIRAAAVAMAMSAGLMAGQASATLLAPGSGPTPTPGLASLAGLTPVASQVIPFTGLDALNNTVFSGFLTNAVYATPGGTLDFAYQVASDPSSPDAEHMVSVNSYSGFLTDVDYVTGSGSVTYATANRLAFASGDTISFDYSAAANSIAPGATADLILIQTNATAFDDLGSTNILDGGGATVATFEPSPSVGLPEPMSGSLLAIGAFGLLGRRSRKAR